MGAKTIQLSADDITYYTLPGSQGELSREGAQVEDTIFGQTYNSNMTGILGWNINANAVYKGFPGYLATLKKPGTSTVMTADAMTLVSGKTYQITNAAKRIINRAVAVSVLDNAIVHTADVLSIDYLFGKVTFKAAYTPTTPITITGQYFPTIDLAKATSYTLTQTGRPIRTTNFPAAAANSGYNTFIPGLRQVAIELPAVFDAADNWDATLAARAEMIIEVNPDGVGKSYGRGFFRLVTDRQAGNVGELEEETLSFQLSVPIEASPNLALAIQAPFSWHHESTSLIPEAIKKALTAFLDETLIYAKYLPDGIAGWKGSGVVSNITLSGGMETPNAFAVGITGSGAMTDV